MIALLRMKQAAVLVRTQREGTPPAGRGPTAPWGFPELDCDIHDGSSEPRHQP